MTSLTDQELLREYARDGSEAAFAELVERHVDLVYSAALRMVRDPHLAEDVTQSAFVALAQRARQLRDRPVLSGWLHRTAQNLAAKSVRSDVRRRAREQEAFAMNEMLSPEAEPVWEPIAPHLDHALGELAEADRDALLLRFFRRQSAREMAQTLGTSEEAAQKRVSRAIDRLRDLFAKRGISVGVSGLMLLLSAHAVQAAPVGLSATITATTSLTKATTVTLKWLNAKLMTAMAAVLIVGTGAVLVQQAKTAQSSSIQSAQHADASVVTGLLKASDGQPVANAEVYLSTASTAVTVYSSPSPQVLSTHTGSDGRFSFPADPENRAVVAINERGYAQATVAELAKQPVMSLQAWAHIEGTLRVGAAPRARQTIHLSRTRFGSKLEQQSFRTVHDTTTKTDADGYYVFPRVAPGDTWISWRSGQGGYDLQFRYLDAKPGQLITADIGGRGRPVTGRASLAGETEGNGKLFGSIWPKTIHQMRRPPNWSELSAAGQANLTAAWENSPDAKLYNQEKCPIDFRIAADGTFTIPDVPAGGYRVVVATWSGAPGASKMLSRGQAVINVPEMPGGRSEQPFEIGLVQAISVRPLRQDDPAPLFETTTFTGQPWKLAEQKGKCLLLSFWRTDVPESLEEMDHLKAAQAKWGADKRFLIVGLNFDRDLPTAQRYASDNKLSWTQCFLGDHSDIPSQYRLRRPTTMLIGPDGLLIDPDLGGPGIATALQEALGAR